MKKLTIAIAQLSSSEDVQENIQKTKELFNKIQYENSHVTVGSTQEKVQLVCLPENAPVLKVSEEGGREVFTSTHFYFQFLKEQAIEKNFSILVGGCPWQEGSCVYNATILVEPTGAIECVYRKIHLFDVDIEGQRSLRESRDVSYGERPQVKVLYGWKCGFSICYDLRFSELYSTYAKEAVDVIFVPAAFLRKTGQAHWHSLLRARAIESQCYVVASAQAGTHRSSSGQERYSFGHSLVVNPWGKVECDLEDNLWDFKIVELDFSKIQAMRTQIPMAQHRRL